MSKWLAIIDREDGAGEQTMFFHPSDRKGAEALCRVTVREGGHAMLGRFNTVPLITTPLRGERERSQ